jgi:hypothetical protein
MSAFFDAADPWRGSGALPQGAASDVTTGQLGTIGVSSAPRVYHTSHGLFWFGLIAATAVGLVGASTHLRFGAEKVNAEVGAKGST